MKKFKVRVERVDEYEIEFDEKHFDKEFIEHYKKYFADYETLEEHAEHIAVFRARFGEMFIEGYGSPMVNGELPFYAQMSEKFLPEVNRHLNINVISEDDFDNMDIEVDEID